MNKQILLIEDEYNIASFISQGLQESGYKVFIAYNGENGLELFREKTIDLIILDLILPGIDGREVARKIRESERQDIPIIMLTALGSTENVVKGLDSGADDYLIKPFKFKELLARIRALLRRNADNIPYKKEIVIKDLILNVDSKMVTRSGVEINLTSTEFRLLEFLMVNKNKVLNRIDILENVWDINFNMGTNVVDVYINYLRNKLDKDFDPKLIQTVIGMGYTIKD